MYMAYQVVAVTAEELTGEQALERADHSAPRHSHTTRRNPSGKK